MQKNPLNLDIEWLVSKEPVQFEYAVNFMQERINKIISGTAKEMIWILEHNSVYTAGISSKDSDLLTNTNIPVFKTNRGGKYTYHGPGVKIIYVMLNLKKFFAPQGPDVAQFVMFLENWIIKILSETGISGEVRKDRVGVWVKSKTEEKKIASIGIRLKKWVSYHGIAININPDLSYFKNIIPCGIKDFGVTSIEELTSKNLEKNYNQIIREKFFLTPIC